HAAPPARDWTRPCLALTGFECQSYAGRNRVRYAEVGAMSLRRWIVQGLCLVLVGGTLTGISGAAPSGGKLRIATVSNRADLVSAGDVLLRVTTPRGVSADDVRLRLNGTDVTSAFRRQSDGHGLGLLSGLRLGDNTVVATAPG